MIPRIVTALVCLLGAIRGIPAVAQTTGLGTVTNVAATNCTPLETPGDPNFRNFDTQITNCYTAVAARTASPIWALFTGIKHLQRHRTTAQS